MTLNLTKCTRRVTDPFNEKFRARILTSISNTTTTSAAARGATSSSTSGSEHDAETDIVSTSSSSSFSSESFPAPNSSFCLSQLVNNFLESNTPSTTNTTEEHLHDSSDSDSDGSYLRSDPNSIIHDVINPTLYNNADQFRNHLLSDVTKAIEIFSIFRAKNKSIFNRNLMAYLRELGYNAAVCKTKWNSSAGGTLTAGNYEFIDVFIPNSPARYIIDPDFSGEFEIARETDNYKVLRSSLPRVFVGKVDDLKKIIRLLCDEARRSMKINGLTLPPWRRNRYMQLKWLGPYRRTTNYTAAMTAVSNFPVKCRSVGFDVPGESGRLLFPPVTRSR